MPDVALLNPADEAVVCREMIEQVRQRLTAVEGNLTHQLLEREQYLLTVGKAQALRALVTELEQTYKRNFKT